jgi:hypothetical protein
MTDLSNLPPEVRTLLDMRGLGQVKNKTAIVIADYILRITAERDALAKRIADAPVGKIGVCWNGHAPVFVGFNAPFEVAPFEDVRDKRVALVKVD